MKPLIGSGYATLPSSCGYGVIYDHGLYTTRKVANIYSGTGVAVAAFIDEPRCKVVYDWISENCEILYQDPVRINAISGRGNFLVVFKRK